ncbi:MAG: hypothetical protein KGO81_03015 [Bacteroidota bacterium]|nr:hypothetical protein [Bacteroidota bacterium]
MKKIFALFIAVSCLMTASFAQGKKDDKAKATKKEMKAMPPKATTKAAAKPAAGPMKKDGTPDMRYKANKEAAKPAGPIKKDGTPDMRYKANKEAAKKKG